MGTPSPQSTKSTSPRLVGLLQLITGVLILPIMDACAKYLGGDLPAGEIAWWRFAIMLTLLLPMILYMRVWHFPLQKCASLMLPGVFIAIATSAFFQALNHMSMAKALTIVFVSPFILTVLSFIFLGEILRMRRILTLLVGFSGAMVVIRPTHIDVDFSVLYPLITACCYAVYLLLLRQNAQHSHPLMTQFMVGCGAISFLSILLILGGFFPHTLPLFVFRWPETIHFPFLLGVGMVALIGHTLIASAARTLPATLIAPLGYIELFSASTIGFLVFGETPDLYTIIGATMIVSSGLYLIYREQQVGKRVSMARASSP